MQSYSGKRRSLKRAGRFGSYALTCLSIILFNSCSLISKPTKLDNKYYATEKKVVEYACLNSSGRGRIQLLKEKKRFTYQAEVKDNNLWLGVDIPFKGQEVLVLPYKWNKKPSGSLYKKTSESLVKKRRFKTLQVFEDFLNSTGRFIGEINRIQKGQCKKKSCLPGFLIEDREDPAYRMNLDHDHTMEISFSNIDDGHYSLISIVALSKSKKPVLKMDLRIESCM